MKEFFKHSRNKTILFWVCAAVALLALAVIESSSANDFDIFLHGSVDLFQFKNIYVIKYNEWYHYYYSVFFAILLKPFTMVPVFAAHMAWIILNVFFVYRTWKVLINLLQACFASQQQKNIFSLLVFLFMLRFLRDNFHHGQTTLLILYLSLEGLNFLFSGKKIAGAAFIALGINIKILPVVLIPYLLYRRQFAATGMIVLFLLVYFFLPSIVIGHQQNMFLAHEWWQLVNPSKSEHMIDTDERSFHGLTTLIPTLLMSKVNDWHVMPLRRNIMDLGVEQVVFIVTIVRLFFVLLTIYFLRTLPFKKSPSPLHSFWELSYILLAVPLLFPHQQHYAFYFCFPSVMYLLYFSFHKKQHTEKMKFINTTLLLIALLFNASILFGAFDIYYDHFKIVTYGALLLIVLLMICKPSEMQNIIDPLPSLRSFTFN